MTNEIYNAIFHTTQAMKELIVYSLEEVKVNYILPGKFQTDNLESRFGQYRHFAGGNYNISVSQVLEANKIRVKTVIGLHSARYGEVKFSTNLLFKINVSVRE